MVVVVVVVVGGSEYVLQYASIESRIVCIEIIFRSRDDDGCRAARQRAMVRKFGPGYARRLARDQRWNVLIFAISLYFFFFCSLVSVEYPSQEFIDVLTLLFNMPNMGLFLGRFLHLQFSRMRTSVSCGGGLSVLNDLEWFP